MSLLKIAESLKEMNRIGLLKKDELVEALIVTIGEIPREYRDAVVKKVWNDCLHTSIVPTNEAVTPA